MATSADYFKQLETLQDPGTDPTIKTLVNERADLESQYLPNLFNPFTQMGTGASDLSPAAKLSALGQSVGRLGSRIGASNSLQDHFTNQFNQKRQNVLQLYQLAREREEAERAAAERAAAMRAQAAMMGGYGSGGGGGSIGGMQTQRPASKSIGINPNTGRTGGIGGEFERALAGVGQGIAGLVTGGQGIKEFMQSGSANVALNRALQEKARAQSQMQQVTNPDRLDASLRKNYGTQGAQLINAYKSQTGLSLNAALEQLRKQGILAQLQKQYGIR